MNISLPALLVVCGVLIVAFLVLFLPFPGSRTKASTPVEHPQSDLIFRDDDRYGSGWTINFGNPRGRLFMIAILLMVLLFGVIIPVLVPGAASSGCHPSGCHLFP